MSQTLSVEVGSGDALDIRHFSVTERISSLFRIDLMVLSENPGIDFDAVVGKPATFKIDPGLPGPAGGLRLWQGVCNRFQQSRVEVKGASTYHLSIVPPLWLATQRRNYRIFQQINEPDIVCEILKEWDIEPELRIDAGAYKTRKYRVQYGESDYDFMCRMLEDVGISFYFMQAGGATKLVLCDAPQDNDPRPEAVPFTDNPSDLNLGDRITAVHVEQQVRPGRYTLRDHDYRRPPEYKLMADASGKNVPIEEKLERFHYVPGAFLFGVASGDATPNADDRGMTRADEAEGAILAQKRLNAKRSSARICTFETSAHDLAPAMVMSMAGHPHPLLGDDKKLLVYECSFSGTHEGDWEHRCEVRSAELPFYPPLATPKPQTKGMESATVVGPPGEEIHTDEFGRVRVHFHWDRYDSMDDKSSCWIHVSQPWGGAGYGGSNLPRIGQEVLVDFLGGDPDRPVIVGRYYTNLQKTPYKLPDSKTMSGWRSSSSPGGGGYNELSMEDKAGKELINMQAQKDLNKLVKNDETVTIGRDRTKLVKQNDDLTVGHNRSKHVRSNEYLAIGSCRSKQVGVNESNKIGVSQINIVGVNQANIVGAVLTTNIGTQLSFKVGKESATKTMTEDTIVWDTGAGATIAMTAGTISFSAAGGVRIESAGGDVNIVGGPMVRINPSAG